MNSQASFLSSFTDFSTCTLGCNKIIETPWILQCGHSCCPTCISKHFKDVSESSNQAYCPICFLELEINQITMSSTISVIYSTAASLVESQKKEALLNGENTYDNLNAFIELLDENNDNNNSPIKKNLEFDEKKNTLFLTTFEAEIKCPVCHEIPKNPTFARCGHSACEDCLNEWLCSNDTCPLCKDNIIPDLLFKNKVITSMCHLYHGITSIIDETKEKFDAPAIEIKQSIVEQLFDDASSLVALLESGNFSLDFLSESTEVFLPENSLVLDEPSTPITQIAIPKQNLLQIKKKPTKRKHENDQSVSKYFPLKQRKTEILEKTSQKKFQTNTSSCKKTFLL